MKIYFKFLLIIGFLLVLPKLSMADSLTSPWSASCPTYVGAESCGTDYVNTAAPSPLLCAPLATMTSRDTSCTTVGPGTGALKCNGTCSWTSSAAFCDPLNKNTTTVSQSLTGPSGTTYSAPNLNVCGGCKSGYTDYGSGCVPVLDDVAINRGPDPDEYFAVPTSGSPVAITIGSDLWSESGSDIHFDTGNVGIGTFNPQERLQVSGGHIKLVAEGFDPYIELVSDDLSDGTTMRIKTLDTIGFAVTDGADNSRFVVTSDGKVGIGTTTPASVFQVLDPSINLDSTFGGLGVAVTGVADGGGGFFADANSSGIVALANDDIGITALGNLWAGFFDDTDQGFNEAWLSIDTYSMWTNGRINLDVSGTGALYVDEAEAVWFDGTSFSWGYGGTKNYFDDSVGIGISPDYKLHVSDRMKLDGSTAGLWIEAGSDWFIGRSGTGGANLRFYRGGVDRVTFTSTGQVGIGTDAPGAGLHIKGASNPDSWIYVDTNSFGVDAGINIMEGGANRGYIYNKNSSNALMMITPGSGQGIEIAQNNGYIGMGFAGPTHRLTLPNTGSNSGRGMANAWLPYSDSRVKLDQKPIAYGLTEVMILQPKQYDHYSSHFEGDELILDDDYSRAIGLVAQEVYEVIPEIVDKPSDESNALWGLDYDKLAPVLVKAIQELKAENDSLREAVCELKPDAEVCNK